MVHKSASASVLTITLLLALSSSALAAGRRPAQTGVKAKSIVEVTPTSPTEILKPLTSPLPIEEQVPNQGSACDPNG